MKSNSRIAGLDHLRALAIVLVLVFHYGFYHRAPIWILPVSANGWSGVDLFFVLSGFLIGHMLMKEIQENNKINFTKFYINRALRILPLYYFMLGVYFLVPDLHESGGGLQPLWRFLTFTQNLPGSLKLNTFSHAWSLSVEEHFYILFPILLLGVARLLRPGSTSKKPSVSPKRTGVIVVSICLYVLFLGLFVKYLTWSNLVSPSILTLRTRAWVTWIYYPSFTHFDGLLFGVVVAAIKAYKPEWAGTIGKFRYLFFGLGIATLVAAVVMIRGFFLTPEASDLVPSLLLFPMIGLGYAFFVLPAAHGKPSNSRRAKLTRYLALWSYSIYLSHKMSFEFVNARLRDVVDVGEATIMVVSLVFAVVVGAALYYAVERPFMIFRSRLKMNRPAAVEGNRELTTVGD